MNLKVSHIYWGILSQQGFLCFITSRLQLLKFSESGGGGCFRSDLRGQTSRGMSEAGGQRLQRHEEGEGLEGQRVESWTEIDQSFSQSVKSSSRFRISAFREVSPSRLRPGTDRVSGERVLEVWLWWDKHKDQVKEAGKKIWVNQSFRCHLTRFFICPPL